MIDILGQSSLILSLVSFSIAVTALTRNLRNKLVLSFAVVCTTVSFWSFFFFLEKIFQSGNFYKGHLFFNLLLSPVCLFFIRILTRSDRLIDRVLQWASIVYSSILTILLFTPIGYRPVVRNLIFFAPSFIVIQNLRLIYYEGLTRKSWIYACALVLLCVATMDHIPGDILPSLGNILLCIYLFFISEAVIYQRLLNVGALLQRVFSILFVSMFFMFIFTIFVGWVEASPSLFLLNAFLASLIIYLLSNPIQKLTELTITRFNSKKYQILKKHIQEAELHLTTVLDTTGLAQLMLHFLDKVLKPESATVFILRSDGAKFRRIRGLRDEQLSIREILVNHPIIEFFKKSVEVPVLLDRYIENEIDRSASQASRAQYQVLLNGLRGLNTNIAIPFLDNKQVLGFVSINSATPPATWGTNWGILTAIYPFFIQANRVLKKMDVYVQLREKDRLATLGEMAAGLAHEIRNPLGAIKGAVQILQSEPKENVPFLKVIVEEVNRLNKVVSRFLDYSRPQLSVSEMVEYDALKLLEKTQLLFDSFMAKENNGIRFELIRPHQSIIPLRFKCSPEQIQQVLINLIQNSTQSLVRKPPTTGGVIRIGVYSKRMNQIVFFVEDNGAGIAREHLEKIFIPFYTTSPEGTGLGLPICVRIVEAHGGQIDVISEEGKMTRFSVFLPV